MFMKRVIVSDENIIGFNRKIYHEKKVQCDHKKQQTFL